MKVKFKFFEISISKQNHISWEVGENKFNISANNWEFFILEAEDENFIVIPLVDFQLVVFFS